MTHILPFFLMVLAEMPPLIPRRPGPWESGAVCTIEGKSHAWDWLHFKPSFWYARNSKSLFLEGIEKILSFNLINTANNSHFTAINMPLTSSDLRTTRTDWQNHVHPWVSGIWNQFFKKNRPSNFPENISFTLKPINTHALSALWGNQAQTIACHCFHSNIPTLRHLVVKKKEVPLK